MPRNSDTCVYCGGGDLVPVAHWMVCPRCSKKYLESIKVEAPKPSWAPELFDKGIPSKSGG